MFSDENHVEQIDKALNVLENVTCLKFERYDSERFINVPDYVTISGETNNCRSKVGRQGGEQFVRLAPDNVNEGCFRIYSILHEFVHTLGFHHIHRQHDRDLYVKIIWENVKNGREDKLKLKPVGEYSDFGAGYDYESIMHYSQYAVSKNGLPTIVPLNFNGSLLGQREKLSDKDILKINRMYNCDGILDHENLILNNE